MRKESFADELVIIASEMGKLFLHSSLLSVLLGRLVKRRPNSDAKLLDFKFNGTALQKFNQNFIFSEYFAINRD